MSARASAEPSPPEIVFNGDFRYLDIDPEVFRAMDDGLRVQHATQRNIEYALSASDDTLGCGCDYPDYAPDGVVADTNAGERHPWLGELPRYRTVAVGEHRVGTVHGDPENLAGWSLALEAIEPPDRLFRDRTGVYGHDHSHRTRPRLATSREVEMLCCNHTGLPCTQDYPLAAGRRLVVNNGCAGLPAFSGRHHGILTRLSADPVPSADSLYGVTVAGLRFDALPVDYDHRRWTAHFLDTRPPATPAHRAYYDRIEHGTWLTPKQSARGAVTCPT